MLRLHRVKYGLTQQELGRQAGLSVRALRDIEQGRVQQLRPASLRRLAAVLGLSPTEAVAAWQENRPTRPLAARGREVAGQPAADGLAIGVLGPLRVHRRGQPLLIGSLKQRGLLGFLALHPDGVVGRDELVDVLWDGHPPATCRDLVATYVARLRRVLAPLPALTATSAIVAVGDGYRLMVDAAQLDLLRFDALAARARAVQATDPAAALALLVQALDCWRGPVLADLPGVVPQHPAAVAAARRRLAAGLAHADLALALGEHQQAADQLRQLTTEEPLHERLHARLMLALAGCGQQAAALEAFAALRDRLAGELGVDPGAELQDAQARVLRGDVPTVQVAGHAATTPSSGLGGQPLPAQLPADVGGFTGRGGPLSVLEALLPSGGSEVPAPVVVAAVSGMAGVGKTALAIHWAHRAAHRFGDGQLYVNLQGYAPGPALKPLQGLAGLLRALGVGPEEIPTDTEQAAGLYRSLLAGKRVLVVLDNARDAEQVRPLLPGSPGCAVVVTSRDRLTGLVATHGAHRFTLDLLTPREAVALLGRVLGPERVEAEPAAAHELAEVCGFLPLALRIAAANLTGRPEKSIAGYLEELRTGDPLDGLAVVGDAQTAVRVAIDHSYDRLAPDSRRLFRLLGLVPGPEISVAGAAALAGVPMEVAGRLLRELVDAHLVEPRGQVGYGLHDLLGLYARERAERENGEAAIRRLLDWYLHSIDAAARLLYPEFLRLPASRAAHTPSSVEFIDPSGAVAWLEAERANLVAVVQHAAAHGPPSAGWLLADALRGYFWLRRPMVEWLLVAQAGLDAATNAGDARAQAAGHLSLGLADQAAGRSQPALRRFTTALTLAHQAGWTNGQALALGSRGIVSLWSGNLGQAADEHARALALYRQGGWLGGQATSLFLLGLVERDLGRLHEAARHQSQARRLNQQIGSRHGEANALGALGEIDLDLGRLNDARQHLTSALRLYRELDSRFGQALFLPSLAAVARDTGNPRKALATAQDALRLAGEIGDRSLEARTHKTLASIHLLQGHHPQAKDHYQRALTLARETPSRLVEAGAQLGLASVCLTLDQPQQTLDHTRQALSIAVQAGMRILEGQAHCAMAAAHQRLGRHDQALEHCQQALDLHRHTDHRLGQARTLHVLGCALRDTGDSQAAARSWQEALELFTDIGSPEADDIRKLLDT